MELLEQLKEYHMEQYAHVKRTAHLCILLGFELGLCTQQLKDLQFIGLYHDIGKLQIPLEILSKKEELTDHEYTVIKLHSLYSISMLETEDAEIRKAILYHHENLDGSGYFQIKEKDLSLYQRIIHIADVYEALTAERCYKPAWGKEKAYKYMMEHSGAMFDEKVVEVLKRIIF